MMFLSREIDKKKSRQITQIVKRKNIRFSVKGIEIYVKANYCWQSKDIEISTQDI